MNPDAFLQDIRNHIARDELEQALQQLQQFLGHSPKLDEVLHQSGRHAAIRQQIRLGTVSHAEASLARNQISAALLQLLRDIDTQQAESPALGEEMTQAITVTHAKNTFTNSTITAGGDIHIGDKHTTQNAEKIYNIEKIDRADFS